MRFAATLLLKYDLFSHNIFAKPLARKPKSSANDAFPSRSTVFAHFDKANNVSAAAAAHFAPCAALAVNNRA